MLNIKSSNLRMLNPKSMSSDELYGFKNPQTQEWNDGVFSMAMRDLSVITDQEPKWVVLDGDVDPEWIETLNSVMDDNKVLTLASNERIVFQPCMRLIFEVGHLNYATPATVSRAGVLYINNNDVGWEPRVLSWIEKLDPKFQHLSHDINKLIHKYVPVILEEFTKWKNEILIRPSTGVQTLLYLLEALMQRGEANLVRADPLTSPTAATSAASVSSSSTPANVQTKTHAQALEMYFIFACVWAFGGALGEDDEEGDYKVEFAQWWDMTWNTIKFPDRGSCFDFYIDDTNCTFAPWSQLISTHTFAASSSGSALLPAPPSGSKGATSAALRRRQQNIKHVNVSSSTTASTNNNSDSSEETTEMNTFLYIPTNYTIRIENVVNLIAGLEKPVMFAGNRGTGKTMLAKHLLETLAKNHDRTNYIVNCNYYTNAARLQAMLELSLERKGGRTFAPIASEKIVYFLDDVNMPYVDAYGTQSAVRIITISVRFWWLV